MWLRAQLGSLDVILIIEGNRICRSKHSEMLERDLSGFVAYNFGFFLFFFSLGQYRNMTIWVETEDHHMP